MYARAPWTEVAEVEPVVLTQDRRLNTATSALKNMVLALVMLVKAMWNVFTQKECFIMFVILLSTAFAHDHIHAEYNSSRVPDMYLFFKKMTCLTCLFVGSVCLLSSWSKNT